MDTVNRPPPDGNDAARPEPESDGQRRLAWEPEMIAEADADSTAGR